jgi:hypothetical protein
LSGVVKTDRRSIQQKEQQPKTTTIQDNPRMTSNTEVYTELLDFGRDKMTEGDYLKLATFLKDLNNNKDESKILLSKHEVFDTLIEFDTLRGKHYSIKLTKARLDIISGSEPNILYITGTVNGIPFESEEKEFSRKWLRIIECFGIKNIKRQSFDSEVDTFIKWGSFKTFVQELVESETQEEEEEEEWLSDEHPIYCVRVLFCINYLYGL